MSYKHLVIFRKETVTRPLYLEKTTNLTVLIKLP